MLIDWFTVCAQAINFLILVWLLKRFLYKPILNAIDTREKLIAAELSDAAAEKVKAQKERDEFRRKNLDFDSGRVAALGKVTDEAKAEGQRLMDMARKSADTFAVNRQDALIKESHATSHAISLRIQEQVFSIARKALSDLATANLEERISDVFTHRLRAISGTAKEELGIALKTGAEPSLVRSTFELPADQRSAIKSAINETFSADIHIRFDTSPALVSGIELTAGGQKIAWSIADYLTSLEKSVTELLNKPTGET
jgi:F-type H+-transporting ATPase subunit b